MKPVRTLAHAMLAAPFVTGATRTLLHPDRAAAQTEPLSEQLTARLSGIAPWLPTGPTAVVRANAVVQLGGAVLLASGRAPRLAAAVLAGSLVPTTVVGHQFWRAEAADRPNQLNHFMKNLALLGGLVLVIVDNQGRPGLGWRAGQAVRRIRDLPHTPR